MYASRRMLTSLKQENIDGLLTGWAQRFRTYWLIPLGPITRLPCAMSGDRVVFQHGLAAHSVAGLPLLTISVRLLSLPRR